MSTMTKLIKLQTAESTVLYIPKDLIDSFSLSDTTFRINFNKEIKVTGFKKADHIIVKAGYDSYRKNILKDLEKTLLKAFTE